MLNTTNAKTWGATAAKASAALLPAIGVVLIAVNGGAYGVYARNVSGILPWLVVLAVIALARWPRRFPSRDAWTVGIWLTALTALTGLSILWSDSAERSFEQLALVAGYLGWFVATVIWVRHRGGRQQITGGLALGLGVVVALAALSRLEPSLFPVQEIQSLSPETAPRLSYPLNYWNGVAALAALALPLFLSQATRRDLAPALRGLAAMALPMSLLVIYLTFSRGGIVAALAGITVFFALSSNRVAVVRPALVGLVGGGLLVGLTRHYSALNGGLDNAAAQSQGHRVLAATLAVSFVAWAVGKLEPERFVPRLRLRRAALRAVVVGLAAVLVFSAAGLASRWADRTVPTENTAAGVETRYVAAGDNGRIRYWEASWHAWKASPITGHGAGTWEFWWLRNATLTAFSRNAHSVIADALAELGLLGLIAILGTFGSVVWVGLRSRRRDPTEANLHAALAGATVAFIVSSSIDWIWQIPAMGMLFWVLAGLLAAGADTEPGGERPARAYGTGLAIAGMAWVFVVVQMVPMLSAWQVNESQAAVKRGDLAAAENSARTARSFEPWAASPSLQIAQVLEKRERFDEAARYAAEAIDRERNNWRNWFVLARIEANLDPALALKHLRAARSLYPHSLVLADLERPDRAFARPDYFADDGISSMAGGDVVRGDAERGELSRRLEPSDQLSTNAVEGLVPGATYNVLFAIKPLADLRAGGAIGDTSGAGWGVKPWNATAHRSWQRYRMQFKATARSERLTFLLHSGGPPVLIDSLSVIRQGHVPDAFADFEPIPSGVPTAAPAYGSDDAMSEFLGGTPIRRGAYKGDFARRVDEGDRIEIPELRGLQRGVRYRVRFHVRSPAGKALNGVVGDTSGAGWSAKRWRVKSSRRWQTVEAVLVADSDSQRLAILLHRGAGAALIDSVTIKPIG